MKTKRTGTLGAIITFLLLMGMVSSVTAHPPADEPVPPGRGPMGIAGGGGPGPVLPILQYQGRLTNPSTGLPVADGAYAVTFSLYKDSSGSAVWTETKNVPVAGGLFSTLVGDVNPLPQSLFNGQELWLGIKVGADPEATPRQTIFPVAYAFSLRAGAVISGSLYDSPILQVTNTDPNASGGGYAISAINYSGYMWRPAIYGENRGASAGVYGRADGWHAVVGWNQSNSFAGVYGFNSSSGQGVYGEGVNGYGVKGLSANGTGVYGTSNGAWGRGVYGTSSYVGVWGEGNWGVYGNSPNYGVMGVSDNGVGVFGRTYTTTSQGVYGTGPTIGVYGIASAGGDGSSGVVAKNNDTISNNYSYGLKAVYGNGSGYSYSDSVAVLADGQEHGVLGYGTGYGTAGLTQSASGWGIFGRSTQSTGYAGYFMGNVYVNGNLSASGTKAFKIDNPVDPANQYLYHYAVESPQVENMYNGTTTLDDKGEAVVKLPDYFSAINTAEFSYYLTAVGAPMPNLYVAQEIQGNSFKIAGGVAGKKVSWMVYGQRNDPWLRDHPATDVVNKPTSEQGTYLYPQGYGQPETAGVNYTRLNPQTTSSSSAPTLPMTPTIPSQPPEHP